VSLYRSDPAAAGANVGRRRGGPVGAQARLASALVRFDASPAARTVAGLTRSLGLPRVSVGAGAGSPSLVRITVAWELCWYQWGVDLGEERRGVFEIAKGSEVTQLDGPARHWNGGVDAGGRIHLGAMVRPPRRRRWLGR
jgi:hypothetical protein